jgi:hypothetical protein
VSSSISYSKFEQWLDNYAANNVSIVGYYEYWTLAQNTYHTQVTDLSIENESSLSFTVDNIGGNSRLFVAAPFAEMVLDGNGNEVPFTDVDGGIIIEVEAGYYVIYGQFWIQHDEGGERFPTNATILLLVTFAAMGGALFILGRIRP